MFRHSAYRRVRWTWERRRRNLEDLWLREPMRTGSKLIYWGEVCGRAQMDGLSTLLVKIFCILYILYQFSSHYFYRWQPAVCAPSEGCENVGILGITPTVSSTIDQISQTSSSPTRMWDQCSTSQLLVAEKKPVSQRCACAVSTFLKWLISNGKQVRAFTSLLKIVNSSLIGR